MDDFDRPRLGVPAALDDALGATVLTSANIKASLATYLTVRTTNKDNGADKVYTQRASAQWSIDYSGAVAFRRYIPSLQAVMPPPSGTFAPEDHGDVVPVTAEPNFVDAIISQGWTTTTD